MRALRLLLLSSALVSSLVIAGVAVAQISANFDLACRGTFASAGGVSVYSGQGFAVMSSVGQPGVGLSTSANVRLRAGFIQPAAHAATELLAAQPTMPAQQNDNTIYLVIVSAMEPVLRICTWF